MEDGGSDGDGQYHHYLTVWMFALDRLSPVEGSCQCEISSSIFIVRTSAESWMSSLSPVFPPSLLFVASVAFVAFGFFLFLAIEGTFGFIIIPSFPATTRSHRVATYKQPAKQFSPREYWRNGRATTGRGLTLACLWNITITQLTWPL